MMGPPGAADSAEQPPPKDEPRIIIP